MDQRRGSSIAEQMDRFDRLITRFEAVADRLQGMDIDIVGPPPLTPAEKRERAVRGAGHFGANHAGVIFFDHPDASHDELLAAMRDHVVAEFRDDDELVEEAMRGAVPALWSLVQDREHNSA